MNSISVLNIFYFIMTLDYQSLWKITFNSLPTVFALFYFPCLPKISVGPIDPSEKMKREQYKCPSFEKDFLCAMGRWSYSDGQMGNEVIQAQGLYFFWLLNGLDYPAI